MDPAQPSSSADPAPALPGEPLGGAAPALAHNPLVGSFSPEDWRRFGAYLEIVRYPAGEVVVEESSPGQDMYFVLEGDARLTRAHVDLGLIGPGTHFGELALIARRLRAASVTAVTPVVLARLSRARYEALSADEPALALRFTQALVGSLGLRLTEMTDSVGLLLRERSLPRRVLVDVRVGGELARVKLGTPAGALLPVTVEGRPVMAALLNNKAVALDTPITSSATVAPLTTDHWEGKRVYRHSLGLLALEAARRAEPGAAFRLGPSIGFAQWLEREPAGGEDSGLAAVDPAAFAARVTAAMRELIAADAPFRSELWTVEEARAHFEEARDRDAATLLRSAREPTVPLVSCGEVHALGLTPLLPGAGRLGAFPFRLEPAGEPDPLNHGRAAFLLHYGDEAEVSLDTPPPSQPGLPAGVQPGSRAGGKAVRGEEPWLRAVGVTSVGDFNEACVVGSVSQIIRVAEGLHEKRIGQIADSIAARAGRVRVICIAGPSSSGKTTFIKRLTVQLQVNGVTPVAISLDDYYLDREKTKRDARGEYDYEAPEALDLGLLRDHLGRIFAGEAVATARYDFATGRSLPSGGPTIALRGSDMLMLEGIHGLNPLLLASVLDRAQVFRVFIQPATGLPFDRLTRVNVSDLRLLRRVVRDRRHRGTNAAANIQRWPSVRAGERAHIFPWLGEADAVFDSALVYELSVLKVFADRYLLEVPQDHPSFVTAHRLRLMLDRFITIYPDHVPPTSILREFIGGSGFEY